MASQGEAHSGQGATQAERRSPAISERGSPARADPLAHSPGPTLRRRTRQLAPPPRQRDSCQDARHVQGHLRGTRDRLAARPRPARPAVAAHARSVSHLAVRDHAAADAGRDGRSRTTSASSPRFPTSQRSPRAPLDARARATGADSATTGARITCTRPRRRSSPSTAARFRAMPPRSRRCPASAARPRRPSRRFAFGARDAILDGNVKRVLARHRGIAGWPGAPKVEAALWDIAEAAAARARRRGLHAGTDGPRRDAVHAREPALRRVPGGDGLRGAPRRPRRRAAGAAAARRRCRSARCACC